MGKYPSREEATVILKAAGCDEGVIRHCNHVAKIASEIAQQINLKSIDLDLIEIGALLHDLGRSQTRTIEHGVLGAEMARRLKLHNALVNIIANHVGAGIPSEEAELLGLPPRDYLPKTPEEKIVCYADKLISHNRKMSYEEARSEIIKELGGGHPALKRFEILHQEILELGISNDRCCSLGKD